MNSLNSALSSIRRSPYQALAAVMISTVTFAVIFGLSYFLSGSQAVLRYYETRPQIIAFFEIEANNEDIQKTKTLMEAKPYVTEVKLTSKEDALKLYSQEYQDSPMLLELVTADILPASIEVSANDINSLAQIKTDLEQAPGIEDVQFQERVVETLRSWTNTARIIGFASAGILALLSFLIITVIVGLRVSAQKRKISVLRLIGATKWYIKRPFMAEGLVYGLTGSLLGWGIATAVVFWLSPDIKSFVNDIALFPIPWQFMAIQFLAGVGGGALLGLFAGLFAGQRLIRL